MPGGERPSRPTAVYHKTAQDAIISFCADEDAATDERWGRLKSQKRKRRAAPAGFHKPVLSKKAPFTRTLAVLGLRYDSIPAPRSDAIARKLHLFSMHRSSAVAESVQNKEKPQQAYCMYVAAGLTQLWAVSARQNQYWVMKPCRSGVAVRLRWLRFCGSTADYFITRNAAQANGAMRSITTRLPSRRPAQFANSARR